MKKQQRGNNNVGGTKREILERMICRSENDCDDLTATTRNNQRKRKESRESE
jgi:hypothetical protein